MASTRASTSPSGPSTMSLGEAVENGAHILAKQGDLDFEVLDGIGQNINDDYTVESGSSGKMYMLVRLDSRRSYNMRKPASKLRLLQSYRHRHLLQLVGSFEDPREREPSGILGLLFTPQVEYSLSDYLRQPDLTYESPQLAAKRQLVKSFFGCLAVTFAELAKEQIPVVYSTEEVMVSGDRLLVKPNIGQPYGTAKREEYSYPADTYHLGGIYHSRVQREGRLEKQTSSYIGLMFLEMTVALAGRNLQNVRLNMMRDTPEPHWRDNDFSMENWLKVAEHVKLPTADKDDLTTALKWATELLMKKDYELDATVSMMRKEPQNRRAIFFGSCCDAHDNVTSSSASGTSTVSGGKT